MPSPPPRNLSPRPRNLAIRWRLAAGLNEYLAYMIIGEAFNERRYVAVALTALSNFNRAAGFELCGEKPPDDPDARQRCERAAVQAVRELDTMSRWDATRARLEADRLARQTAEGAATADGVALVYLITHAELGAAKVGIADTSGSRLAQHRREGWQIQAVFQVNAKSAAAIETDVLKWWRGALGLPSYLTRAQMPQGGWTETVAAARIDLAATVTRLCKLAVQQDARPSRSQSGRPSACGRQAS